MPRYAGPSRKLTNKITLALNEADTQRADACAARLGVPRSDAIRTGIGLLYITLLSQKPIGATLQPTDEGSIS